MTKTAIIAGSSGLIGSRLLNLLLNNNEYNKIISVGRRKLQIDHPKLKQEIIDFADTAYYQSLIKGDVIFCCLGTTQKQTPSRENYYKIDHDYPMNFAKAAVMNGISQLHFISAIGADASSGNFYLKTKGEAERDLKTVGLKSLFIYQPSLLTGRDNNKRLVESIGGVVMRVINPLLLGSLKKYRSIAAQTVAKAMYNESLQKKPGVFVYTTEKIKERA